MTLGSLRVGLGLGLAALQTACSYNFDGFRVDENRQGDSQLDASADPVLAPDSGATGGAGSVPGTQQDSSVAADGGADDVDSGPAQAMEAGAFVPDAGAPSASCTELTERCGAAEHACIARCSATLTECLAGCTKSRCEKHCRAQETTCQTGCADQCSACFAGAPGSAAAPCVASCR